MKTEYLQAMGITYWRLRQAQQFYLLSGSAQRCGVLVAKFSIGGFDQEQELLASIIKALKIEATLIPQPPKLVSVIALGAYPNAINTYSLAEMLQNPSLKAPVWRELQNFISSLR